MGLCIQRLLARRRSERGTQPTGKCARITDFVAPDRPGADRRQRNQPGWPRILVDWQYEGTGYAATFDLGLNLG